MFGRSLVGRRMGLSEEDFKRERNRNRGREREHSIAMTFLLCWGSECMDSEWNL